MDSQGLCQQSKITINPAQMASDQEVDLLAYDGPDRIITASEYRQMLKDRPKNKVKFKTCIAGLDEMVDGVEGGELVVISGPTKCGKTLLSQTLTYNFANIGVSSLWFSFEVPMDQFLSQIPGDCEFCIPKMLIPYKPDWLHNRIEESKLKHNTRAVFIDHLHFLIDIERNNRNMSLDIGSIVRQLKREAIRLNVVIFLLCHSTKAQGANGEIRELGAMDMRDSSFIAQEADTTWIVQRKAKTKEKIDGKWVKLENPIYTNKAILKVCNHRRTGVMEKRITLEKLDGQPLFREFGVEYKEARKLEDKSVPESDMEVQDFTAQTGEPEESLPF